MGVSRRLVVVLCVLSAALLGTPPAVASASASPALPFTPIAHPHVEALSGPGIEHNSPSDTPDTTYTGQIVNRNSNKCMEVYHSETGNGANVDQWTCNGTYTQYWVYHDPHTGVGITFFNLNSDLVLEVSHSSTANYGNVDQWIANYTDTQHWDRPILA